jgi:hypothetical protein
MLIIASALRVNADQLDTQSGERLLGKVVSVDAETLVFSSETLGTVKLPRGKISRITLGAGSPFQVSQTNSVATHTTSPSPSAPATNSNPELAAVVRQLGSNSNLIQQVQAQFLNGAGPEAKEKFNQLLGGYLSGKLTVNDIRDEAKTAADQLRSARNELGGDSGFMLDSYLAILDNFLKETASAGTNVSKSISP